MPYNFQLLSLGFDIYHAKGIDWLSEPLINNSYNQCSLF